MCKRVHNRHPGIPSASVRFALPSVVVPSSTSCMSLFMQGFFVACPPHIKPLKGKNMTAAIGVGYDIKSRPEGCLG
jgi:hypothetical protein